MCASVESSSAGHSRTKHRVRRALEAPSSSRCLDACVFPVLVGCPPMCFSRMEEETSTVRECRWAFEEGGVWVANS
eukprot:scaffold1499_cov318-Pavlova_lutheri.AAC.5